MRVQCMAIMLKVMVLSSHKHVGVNGLCALCELLDSLQCTRKSSAGAQLASVVIALVDFVEKSTDSAAIQSRRTRGSRIFNTMINFIDTVRN